MASEYVRFKQNNQSLYSKLFSQGHPKNKIGGYKIELPVRLGARAELGLSSNAAHII